MWLVYFIEGPFLWIAFLALISAVAIRLALKCYTIIHSSHDRDHRWRYVLTTFGRMVIPYHKAAANKPFLSALGYVFHICLIAVPIWFSGHITLWEDSRFEWTWTPIPDVWADGMTLVLLALALGLVIRLIAASGQSRKTERSGGVLLLLVILPFASGLLLTHGILESIPFFSEYLFTIHILAAELLLLTTGFLFLRAHLDPQACIGCTACELNCPTGALDYADQGDRRTFRYSPYQCIACGSCEKSCPEGAVQLRHHMSFSAIATSLFRKPIRSVALQQCANCGKRFAPQPQVDKIADQIDADYIHLCEECKEHKNTTVFYPVAKDLQKYIDALKRFASGQKPEPTDLQPYKWQKIDPQNRGRRQTLFGICGGCMQRDCASLVHLEDGVAVKIEGNPESPPNYGTLCPKGNSEIMGYYNPYRIKAPLVRTNPEKGLDVDPMWKEVSWDEALSIVIKRLEEVREKDPRGFVMCEGWGNRDTFLRPHFVKAFGSPNEIGSHGPLCTVHYASGLVQAAFPVGIVDLEHCRYHVTLGRSIGPNFSTNTTIRKLAKALDRGMKLVVVDPRCSIEASKGQWVPIRPGTDLAFLLAMAHVIMHEIKTFDNRFLQERTNAPYLIGPDGNYFKDPATGKPLIWDEPEKAAKPFNADFVDIALTGSHRVAGVECRTGFEIIRQEFQKYTPEWAEKVCTVPAATIRQIAAEFVEHAQIGSTIDIDGFTFPFRPVSLNTERNVTNHRGGTYADLTGKLINMLVGNIEIPGGNMANGPRGPVLEPGDDGVVKPGFEAVGVPFTFPPHHIDGAEFYPNKHTAPHLTAMAILNPGKYHHDYEVQAWMTHGSNPIRKTAQPDLWVEMFKKIPFHFSIAYCMDEPTILADVVLPEHSFLERMRVEVFHMQHQAIDDDVNGLHMIQLRQPVPALFNTRHSDDILMDLAEGLGILKGKGGLNDLLNESIDFLSRQDGLNLADDHKLDIHTRYPLEQIFDRQIRSWRHNHQNWGLAELMQAGFLEHRVPRKEFYNYFYFPDSQTRHPFYFQHLKAVGDELRANLDKLGIAFPGVDDTDHIFDLYDPVPHWVENSEFRAPQEFDLWAFNWRTPYYSNDQSNMTGNPWLAEIYQKDPTDGTICLNTATAAARHLQEGDWVIVESRYGKVEGRVHASELFHPDAVGISGCYGLGTMQLNPLSRKGPHFNSLLPMDDTSLDAVSAGMEIAPRVKVYKKDPSV